MLAVKASKLSANVIIKILKWFVENGKDNMKFKETTGKVDMIKLHEKSNSVKFLPNELDKEEMKLISSMFEKYNVLFAVEKQANGNYTIAFAGKDEQTIEYAMRKVIEEQNQHINKKSKIESIRKNHISYQKEREQKEKDKSKEKQMNDRER